MRESLTPSSPVGAVQSLVKLSGSAERSPVIVWVTGTWATFSLFQPHVDLLLFNLWNTLLKTLQQNVDFSLSHLSRHKTHLIRRVFFLIKTKQPNFQNTPPKLDSTLLNQVPSLHIRFIQKEGGDWKTCEKHQRPLQISISELSGKPLPSPSALHDRDWSSWHGRE